MSEFPDTLSRLEDIACNVFWRWHPAGHALFEGIHGRLWEETHHRPLEFLRNVDPVRLREAADDPELCRLHDRLAADLDEIRRTGLTGGDGGRLERPDMPWPGPGAPEAGPVAYFCAEFGVDPELPIYSGGLGVLAGDHLKAASDLRVPMVGVGLLYREGYFRQRIRADGWQEDHGEPFEPVEAPVTPVTDDHGDPLEVTLEIDGRPVGIRLWQVAVGRVPLYLLDTDLPSNDADARRLTRRLYGGGTPVRLRQEWLLGTGGVRALRAAGVSPSVWHANEGHASFMMVERVREQTSDGVPFREAVARVRSRSVFTTHTPVPAGHDIFRPDEVREVTGPVWEDMGIEEDDFTGLAAHPDDDSDGFHMTALAIRLAGRTNGVSELHGQVTRDLWRGLWPDRDPERVPVGHVTNGVHLPTWGAGDVGRLAGLTGWRGASASGGNADEGGDAGSEGPRPATGGAGPQGPEHPGDPSRDDIDPRALWDTHRELKTRLVGVVRREARRRWGDRGGDTGPLAAAGALLDPRPFTIGFARRFAAYKRADLLFRQPDRLRHLLTDPDRPVQILFAGKAHPADDLGKGILQTVHEHARDPAFEGRIAVLENYDMYLARLLVQGVDLWLNLPRPPKEACGTSGMKAALNGIPQLGTDDGWWAEGYRQDNGWRLPAPPAEADPEEIDQADVEHVFRLLEGEIVPLFYDRDDDGLPRGWIERMAASIRAAGERFSARRMLEEYTERYYRPAAAGEAGPGQPPTR